MPKVIEEHSPENRKKIGRCRCLKKKYQGTKIKFIERSNQLYPVRRTLERNHMSIIK